jgi:hypothetical protein
LGKPIGTGTGGGPESAWDGNGSAAKSHLPLGTLASALQTFLGEKVKKRWGAPRPQQGSDTPDFGSKHLSVPPRVISVTQLLGKFPDRDPRGQAVPALPPTEVASKDQQGGCPVLPHRTV